jgi:putative glycosyltransferase (TIGR04372 family)
MITKFKRTIQRVLLAILSLTRVSSEKKVSGRQVLLTFSEGIIGVKGSSTYDKFIALEKIERLWNLGLYQESILIRSQLLEKIYREFDTFRPDYSPPIYSPLFMSNVGHVPAFMMHQSLVHAGKILEVPRVLPNVRRGFGNHVAKAFNLDRIGVQQINISSDGLMQEIPSMMHMFERLDCFWTLTGFRDLYELLEESYSGRVVNQRFPLLGLSEEFSYEKSAELRRRGIYEEDRFVTVHVRPKRGDKDPRGAIFDSFEPSIRFLLSKGIKVIVIGGDQDALLNTEAILEIKGEKSFGLQTYCVANALFHLGTHSGPTELAKALGTPILQTNTTSLGRNTFTGSQFTMYLPKHILRDGHPLRLSEILDSPIAYAEELGILKSGVKMRENSPEEILRAVEEILYVISTKDKRYYDSANVSVNAIRKDFKSFVRGSFSPSFLSSNPHFNA